MRRNVRSKRGEQANPSSKQESSRPGSEDRETTAADAAYSSRGRGLHPTRSRRWPWWVFGALAVPLLLIGNLGAWVTWNIADTSNFVQTTREALAREDVREALATRIVDNVLPQNPIVRAAAGNSLVSAVTGFLGSGSFQAVSGSVATQLHQALVRGEHPSITIESRELQNAMSDVARNLTPIHVGGLMVEEGMLRIELFSGADIPSFAPEITFLRWVGVAAMVIGALLMTLPMFVRRDRWSVGLAGLALVATSLLTFVLAPLVSSMIVQRIADPQARIVIAGIVDGFSTSLVRQTLVILLAGIALCLYGFGPWTSGRQRTR